MATYIIYGQVADGEVVSAANYVDGYSVARAGGTMVLHSAASGLLRIGQSYTFGVEFGPSNWYYACYENFISFDTSAIPTTEVVSSNSLFLAQYSGSSLWIYVYARDWGTAVDTGDYLAGSTLYASPSLKVGTIGAGLDPTITNIDPSTATRFLLAGQRMVNGTVPSTDETAYLYSADASGTGFDPALTIYTLSGAPYAPTLTQPENFDPTIDQTLAWKFNAPSPTNTQSAYRIMITNYSTGALVLDTGKVISTSPSRLITANTLTSAAYMQWAVITWDAQDAVGPASAPQTFTTSTSPVAVITSPSAPLTATIYDYYDVVWTYSQADGSPQAAYRVILTKTSDASVLYDSGVVTSAALTQRVTGLLGGVSCTVSVTVASTLGTGSVPVTQTILATYDAPDAPTLVATPSGAGIHIDITNPTPTGSKLLPSYNQLWSTNVGNGHHDTPDGSPGYQTFGAYFLILDNIPINTPVYDYGVVAGAAAGGPSKYETYFVRAVA